MRSYTILHGIERLARTRLTDILYISGAYSPLSPLYLLRLGNEGLGGRWGDYNMDFSFVGFKFGMAGKKEDVWVYVIPTSG